MLKKECFSLRHSQGKKKKLKIKIEIFLRARKRIHHMPTSQRAYALVLK